MAYVAAVALTFLIAFLLGSIPWGVVISRVFYHTDIREHGSGNIGTTNAMRTMGKVGGGAVFVLDFVKGLASGFVALGLSTWLLPDGGLTSASAISQNFVLSIGMMGCVFGHIFNPWLGGHGGKGIAVAVGALFVTFGPVGACIEAFVIFAPLVLLTRYVSVGSISAAILCPFIACYLFWGDWPTIIVYLVAASVVVWAHRENIGRLRAGNERKVGGPKE